jgi:hypothetical protein
MRDFTVFTRHQTFVIKSTTLRCVGHVAGIGVKKYAYRVLVGKSVRNRPLGRSRRRRDNNIKVHHKSGGRELNRFTGLGQEQVACCC